MSPPASGGSARAKAKDNLVKAAETAVTDAATATEYLLDGNFITEDDKFTLEFLSVIAMQLSQQPKLSTKKASEAFKALSYLLFNMYQRRTVKAIMDLTVEAIGLATKKAGKSWRK